MGWQSGGEDCGCVATEVVDVKTGAKIMKVIISCCGWFHARHAALAAYKHGCLERFVTTNVYGSQVPEAFTKRIRFIETLEWAGNQIPLLRDMISFNLVKKGLYDIWVSRYVGDCDIFHTFSSFQPICFAKARGKGAITILDWGAAHPVVRKELLGEEYEKCGVEKTPDSIERQLQEFENVDYIFVASQFAYNGFVQNGLNPNKLFKIPYGANLGLFKPIAKQDDIFRVIFVGGLRIRKGVHYLLEAVDQLNLPNFELLLVGRCREGIKPFLERYNNYKHVDGVPHTELYKWYSNSSVFVLPSLCDGFGMVVPEAMACGLPVIVTTNTGASDIVRDGKDGFVIPIRDVEVLQDKILFFYKNEDARVEMGRNAREHVQQFTWERYGQRLIQHYHEVLS